MQEEMKREKIKKPGGEKVRKREEARHKHTDLIFVLSFLLS